MFAGFGKFVRGLFCEDDAGTIPAPERVFGGAAHMTLFSGTIYHVIHTGQFAAAEMTAFGVAVVAISGVTSAGIVAKSHWDADAVKPAKDGS